MFTPVWPTAELVMVAGVMGASERRVPLIPWKDVRFTARNKPGGGAGGETGGGAPLPKKAEPVGVPSGEGNLKIDTRPPLRTFGPARKRLSLNAAYAPP